MTIGAFVLLIVGLVIAGVVSYYIITKFFKEPLVTILLAVVGLLLLAVLIWNVFPGATSHKLW